MTSRSFSPGPPFLRATTDRVELAAITARHGVQLTRDALDLVDPGRHEVLTQGGARPWYDVLVLASARPVRSVEGAMVFRGLQDLAAVAAALAPVASVAFIASSTAMWTAPLYELAVQTAAWAADRRKVLDVCVITAETVGEPDASRLAAARVTVVPEAVVDRMSDGRLVLEDGRRLAAALAFALPHLIGPIVRGMPPRSVGGYTRVDETGHVSGLSDVYAIGDMTGRRLPADAQARSTVAAIVASEDYRRGYG